MNIARLSVLVFIPKIDVINEEKVGAIEICSYLFFIYRHTQASLVIHLL